MEMVSRTGGKNEERDKTPGKEEISKVFLPAHSLSRRLFLGREGVSHHMEPNSGIGIAHVHVSVHLNAIKWDW